MKINVFKRTMSAFLAFVMVFLMMPVVSFSEEVDDGYSTGDYTPFLIESANNMSVYNADTADMAYDFYMAARSYIDDYAGDKLYPVKEGDFSFRNNENTYVPESVYFCKPQKYPSCGLLTGVLNYKVGDTVKHIVLLAFRGSDRIEDWITDAAVATGDDGYHEGFEETAQRHYENLMEGDVVYNLGNGNNISFADYIEKMTAGDADYKMIVTGHSLGAAVAGVFTSKYLDNVNDITASNAVAYTFASPLTCSKKQAEKEAGTVKNVFNIVNKDDFVTQIGANVIEGSRTGIDLKYKLGKYKAFTKNKLLGLLTTGGWIDLGINFSEYANNHHMGTAYVPTKNYVNDHINEYTNYYVLYNNYDAASNTYQRIIYSNGQLLVSGNGFLDGKWSDNTLVAWAKVKDKCTSLVFSKDCKITEIGDYAFAGMTKLSNELELPETVTKIGNYAFFHCGFSGDLILHRGYESVGVSAFYGCSFSKVDLSTINLNKFNWGLNAFKGCVAPDSLLLPPEAEQTQDISEFGFRYYYEKDNRIESVTVNNGTTSEPNLTGETYKVEPESTIHCRTLDENKLESNKFSFIFLITIYDTTVIGDPSQYYTNYKDWIIVDPYTGVVEITKECPEISFRVGAYHMKDDGTAAYGTRHYYIDFNVINESSIYSGGFGTPDRPYLIAAKEQLEYIVGKDNEGVYFELIDNIDFSGAEISCLGDFYGYLNGNGYSIEGFTLKNGGTDYLGLFKEIKKSAKISNLNIGSKNSSTTISINSYAGTSAYCGALAAINSGTIENCMVVNANVVSHVDTTDDSAVKYSHAGGVVGDNLGTIKSSGAISCKIDATAYSKDDGQWGNHENAYAWAGGIAGKNSGMISYCYSYENTIEAYTEANSCGTDDAYGYSYVGGMIGEYISGNISYIVTCDKNKLNPSGRTSSQYIFPVGSGTAKINKYSDSLVSNTKLKDVTHIHLVEKYQLEGDSGIEEFLKVFNDTDTYPIPKASEMITYIEVYHPSKIKYYIGESLNLYGIIIKDSNGNAVNGYTVSGFDSNTPGEKTVKVSYKSGYSEEILNATFTVTVENIVPECVTVQPKKEQYDINSKLSLNDFSATVYYNNGIVEFLDTLEKSGSNVSFVPTFSVTLSSVGEQTVELVCGYTGETGTNYITGTTSVNVNCDCTTTTVENAMPATATEYGYTGDVVCSTCKSIVEEGTVIEIPKCDEHKYGEWEKYDGEQHYHVCACGSKEYADHIWDEGTVTVEPTFTASGEGVKTCSECGATEAYEIPPKDDPENCPEIVVDDKSAIIGKTVTVNISLKNNTGITSMRINVAYDSKLLTLTDVKYNTAMGGQSVLPENIEQVNGNFVLYWVDGFTNYSKDDVFATLTFTVKDDAIVGSTVISVTYDAEDIYDEDEKNVTFKCKDGTIVIKNYTPGDINGDGVLTSKDTTRLMRYLAGWNVEVNDVALDVNGDGVVNTKDTTRLMRYLAGWDVEIF